MLKMFKKEKMPYQKEIEEIRGYILDIQEKSQEELISHIDEIKSIKDPAVRKNMSFALMSVVISRTLHMDAYDVQLAGGIALSNGNIAQMKTGEGKTITALFPALWGYIEGCKTYIITVNEYLAERDFMQAQEVFDYLRINLGLVSRAQQLKEKQENYKEPIIYTTNSEFAFDYLRDNIASSADNFMQGDFDFVIIDEADLVLIDEAKNPVIISGNETDNSFYYKTARNFVKTLNEEDYEIDEETLLSDLTDAGYDKAKRVFGYELPTNKEMYQAVRQSLLAEFKFTKDVDYIVKEGEIFIVDKFTGRVLAGRRFQDGLHQAIEAKENVKVKTENRALATTTYQSLLRKFKIMSGMTGTAIESAKELQNIYKVGVEVIPTNRPMVRNDRPDIMFETKQDKYNYMLELIKEKHEKGQPILIGTTSVKESEEIFEILDSEGFELSILNAKNDKNEAEIVALAGEKGAITIATNMAGRGTDIKISKEVEDFGGLFVLGSSRNEALRIDRQLRGRSGRQGERGESLYLTSLEDDLFILNTSYEYKKFVKKVKNFPVTDLSASKAVDSVQTALQGTYAKVRESQYKMDELVGLQRDYTYKKRREILQGEFNFIVELGSLERAIEDAVRVFIEREKEIGEKNQKISETKLAEFIKRDFGIKISVDEQEYNLSNQKEVDELSKAISEETFFELAEILKTAENASSFECVNNLIKRIKLEILDKSWIDYLHEIDLLKISIGFMAMGEKDPVQSFILEADSIFKEMTVASNKEFIQGIVEQFTQKEFSIERDYFLTMPIRKDYSFKVQAENPEEEIVIRAVLSTGGTVLFDQTSSGVGSVIIAISGPLKPAMYEIKLYNGDNELKDIRFKVVPEIEEVYNVRSEAIDIVVPFEEICQTGALMYQAVLTRPDNTNLVIDLPVGHNGITLGKNEGEDWPIGRYAFAFTTGGLPLYTKEFEIVGDVFARIAG